MNEKEKCEVCQGTFGDVEFKGYPQFKILGGKGLRSPGGKSFLCKYCREFFNAEEVEPFIP